MRRAKLDSRILRFSRSSLITSLTGAQSTLSPPLMPTQARLKKVTAGVSAAADTLEIVSATVKTPFLDAICITTRALLNAVETVKQNKDGCSELLEQTHQLLHAIIALHIKSDRGELSPLALNNIANFTKTLHKIHHFVEAQQQRSRIRNFFRQGEMNALLKDCSAELQQALDFFHVGAMDSVLMDATTLQEYSENRHREVLELIDNLADANGSDGASSINRLFSSAESSLISISVLPSEPKIFHGRELELSQILEYFSNEPIRVAILGAGGMGKTSLARAVIHNPGIAAAYGQRRFFITCDTASSKVELAGLLAAQVGIKGGRDLSRPVLRHFAVAPPSLLVLDNLETLWDQRESRGEIEEFLSLLTDIQHLALIITMRGAERPAKVGWTRPFLPPLQPLSQDAARKTFVDIADDDHDSKDIDKVLLLTDNLPLAISLVAHLVDLEGCSNVLHRWEQERTSIISEGHDRRSNLDLSISLSLSSPRVTSSPNSRELLSLLGMLPDGLSDVELRQSNIPINDILSCKATLLGTSLAYNDEQGRIKSLVPIREYMLVFHPPKDYLLRPLLKYFHQLLDVYQANRGTLSHPELTTRMESNISNMQNVLRNALHRGNPDLAATIYSTCHLDMFSVASGRGRIPCMQLIPDALPRPSNHRLEVYVIIRLLHLWRYHPILDPEELVNQAQQHFKYIDDFDLECRFYLALGQYYQYHDDNRLKAEECYQKALLSSISNGDIRRQTDSLDALANIEWQNGDYLAGQKHAYESRRLSRISADLFREARALRTEAMCWNNLGNFKHTISLCKWARELLALCGLSGGEVDCAIMNTQAEIHKQKSEYMEARDINNQILQKISFEQEPFDHALAVFNLSELEVQIGGPKAVVQRNIDTVKAMFSTIGYLRGFACCDMLLGDLKLREGELASAEQLFEKCVKSSQGKDGEIMSYCLERLGNPRCWTVAKSSYTWTVIFLAHVLQSQEKLGLFKALQFWGDVFLNQGETKSAASLYTVALEGFTQLDIHRSRGECLVGLGEISQCQGDLSDALEHWKMARGLFERSSQTKQVADIDERLERTQREVQQRHQRNLTLLSDLRAPAGELDGVQVVESEDIEQNGEPQNQSLDGQRVVVSVQSE
ncbi:hypothetical protein MVEN_01977400 [Mycena venus]|uniref:Novel STAND NTPase 1 domain-containing protein n=1 Tax=Mycena venus TaxID=2733690 RepID=A0A8H7CK71_9AGAR|nr:hypothetical protein MVEN_01977400 [Mycena venus]